ncbi:MAG: hypothetical protein J6N71_02285 [Muribaculaceae bacterium]|nr:hypothetical protein [Muribaculaceae bacterium]
MIRKLLSIMMLAAVAMLGMQCSTVSKLEKEAYQVRYLPLNNYFVRNDIEATKLQKLIITNETDFRSFFGEAAVMGRNGHPTPVNFKTEYVLAVILPETDRSTDVTVLDVLQNGNSVIFNYHVERGEKNSYSLVPFAAVSLPKPRTTQNMEFYFNKK